MTPNRIAAAAAASVCLFLASLPSVEGTEKFSALLNGLALLFALLALMPSSPLRIMRDND
jgi:hypothetical protein